MHLLYIQDFTGLAAYRCYAFAWKMS